MPVKKKAAVQPQMSYVSLELITPYDNNPRINDQAVAGVVSSIKQYGFLVPLVLDQEGVIVTGHTRYKAAVELGLKEVPVIYATDLTEEQVRAFRLADNRLSENSKWDESLLADELAMLESMGFSLLETGFNQAEIDCLLQPISADCLDDLSLDAVCGDIEEVQKLAPKMAVVTIGLFQFRLSKEDYFNWELKFREKYGPDREAVVQHIIKALEMGDAYANTMAKLEPVANAQ